MTYTLEQLAGDIKAALKADAGHGGKEAVCKLVSRVCRDRDFISKHLTAEQCKPRKVLYEDPELGFCICGHVYEKPAHGSPHDHGSSWAIYGVAVGDTEMSDWRIVKKGDSTSPTLVERERTYLLRPGDTISLRFLSVAKRPRSGFQASATSMSSVLPRPVAAGRQPPLRRRRRALAQARHHHQAGPHRGRQSRPGEALEHQGSAEGRGGVAAPSNPSSDRRCG
jgi:hypothetical protein